MIANDVSTDTTETVIRAYQEKNPKVVLINHEKNLGVGGAIASGYKWSRDHDVDISVVMAGDGQMDPDDMPLLLFEIPS